MTAPILVTVARHRSAPAGALPMLVLLIDAGLLTHDWQRVKLLTAGMLLGCSSQYAGRVLSWLCANHYLERCDEPFVGALYRLRSPG